MHYIVTCTNCRKEIRLARQDGLVNRAACPECGKPNPLPMKPGPGTILGSGYRLDRAFGDLFLGYQEAIQRQVLIKVLPPSTQVDEESVGRFLRETKLVAGLRHGTILAAIDAGVDCGTYFLVTEYVPGVTLHDHLKRNDGKLSDKDACALLTGIAEGLQYAWNEGKIVHRNVKPSNILVTDDGKAMLMDLGIAKSVAENAANVTGTGFIVGTPEYMSPEQAQGGDIDFRTDMYSFGIVLYQCVTGDLPFRGDSPVEVLTKQVEVPPVPPRQANPAVSEKCSTMIERLLQKEPGKRYATWDEVLYAMRFVAFGTTSAMPAVGGAKVGAAPAPAAAPAPVRERRAPAADPSRQVADRLIKELQKPAPRGNLMMLYALAFVVPIAVAVMVYVMMQRAQPPPPPAKATPPAGTVQPLAAVAPAEPVAAAPGDGGTKADAAREMYEYAQEFEKQNEARPAEVVATYRKVCEQLAGTKYALMAENDVRRLNATYETARQELLQQLKQQAQPLVDARKYAEAAAVYRNCKGALATQTRKEREDLAAAVEALAAQAQAQDKQKTEQMTQTMQALRDKLVAGLCSNNMTLVSMLAKQIPDDAAGAAGLDLKPLRALAETAARADTLIAKSFAADIDKTVKVRLADGETEMTIRGVEGKVIAADKLIHSKSGGDGKLGIKFSSQTLALKEKLTRLQKQNLEQGNLVSGLVALWSGDRTAATNLFEADGSELGTQLAAAAKKP